NSAEILMARIGHEGSRVGDHTDEAREQIDVGKRVQLPLHAFLLIQEPPTAAKLNFSVKAFAGKASDECGKGVILDRIGVVHNRFREYVVLLKPIEKICQGR